MDKKEKTVFLGFRVSSETSLSLKKIADEESMPVSTLVRRWLKKSITDYERGECE